MGRFFASFVAITYRGSNMNDLLIVVRRFYEKTGIAKCALQGFR